ncbi:twitching motility protein (plasmid) [Deferribacter desulfuricans SSM1]|uniref:Twitching motility protein n=1 Tax=Deferribacter desulfuricans (strain DSM 14783 / JCM 11476 / NBRC 101012 / SSM1) TaxID=639282 RepID=D3PEP0_DEFDS|nr:ATPase, T2SS/T4P/T4SS family [Deferribacter desulfuricans]BAI81682.1 twitching motility protein [Deferribacter desulfuricans SSM1]
MLIQQQKSNLIKQQIVNLLNQKPSITDFILSENSLHIVENNNVIPIQQNIDQNIKECLIDFFLELANNYISSYEHEIKSEIKLKNYLKRISSLNFSFGLDNYRFRGNLFVASNIIHCVLRIISSDIKSFEELGFNRTQMISLLNSKSHGLILISGVTGSGKSTTAASILDYYNKTRKYHIITIEDPVEYKLVEKQSKITQREVGSDTVNFKQALKDSLRQKPHVLFIGEVRDLEVAEILLHATLTGHLVITTIHASSVIQSINRFIGLFPASQEEVIKRTFAHVLLGCINQRLEYVPTSNKMQLKYEMLIVDDTARVIIQQDKRMYGQLKDVMRRQGSPILEY